MTSTTGETRTVAASAHDLVKVYGKDETEVRALDGVTVDLYAGEFTAVMGPSGSGKSTLMHCLAALDTPSGGEAVVGGTPLGKLKDKDLTQLRREQIGFVFQAFNLVPTLTAQENITLPLDLAGRKADPEWFDRVIDAAIVFADEPTGNLDSTSSAEVLGFLRRSVDDFGQTIVMVTHDPVAASYTDRVIFLADGRIVDELHRPDRDSILEAMARLTPKAG